MTPIELEQYLQLMTKYNLDSLEFDGIKITMRNTVTAPKANAPAVVESKFKMPPTEEELALWSTQAPDPNKVLADILPPRNSTYNNTSTKKANKGS